ncbi:SusD-like starch-binding protein associating with outer membrane [Flavobacterium araucananum]|uniref:RagB/SusD family nutrient uptake outer membrane protein n=1 Tax=Flavobacterium araucananum TaxID=946678 RepID=A0A227PFP5_9FLAO|nr:RagB/SusD family nutrient uptake outer membrane protein [Flavobacterium araucananum]OXG08632.1 RagB/SusD family nutrient uptake outer membrane protein [Flavobacterium araucananum]PWJ97884.1 SusD-like starch-binding protein associating with outer membrane [Flavobacterium araucananum]
MKNTLKNIVKGSTVALMILLLCLPVGCESFVEADDPKGQLPQATIFENEETATAAVTTLYGRLRDDVLLTGNLYGLNALIGFYSDEFDYYAAPGQPVATFYNHNVIASNDIIKTLWNGTYSAIYMSNSALEGLEASENLSATTKNQLKGEALFVRSLCHFYLVELFGDVPYIQTTDYTANQHVTRMSEEQVYINLVQDLIEAKTLLDEDYVSGERIRANTFAVSALLARVYLSMGHWEDAQNESSAVINAPMYQLEANLANEFLKESTSAIFQLKPKNAGQNTQEAVTFLFVTGPPPLMALNYGLEEAFETNDLRRQQWVVEISDGNQSWYAPYKYRQSANTGTSQEYSIVLRLAEQYLIRAEARVNLGDLSGAREDINQIRHRAGLSDTQAFSVAEILQSVLRERRVELFSEYGQRWFDLKRFGQAQEILSPIKPNWRPTDVLLPVPETELLMNPNLAPQNSGY